ncbi:hypothetical protein [Azospirillum doebereinerae]
MPERAAFFLAWIVVAPLPAVAGMGLRGHAQRLDEIAAVCPRLREILADIFRHPNGTPPTISPLWLVAGLLILLATPQFAAAVLLTDRRLRILTAPDDPERRPLPLDGAAACGLQRTVMTVVLLTAGAGVVGTAMIWAMALTGTRAPARCWYGGCSTSVCGGAGLCGLGADD